MTAQNLIDHHLESNPKAKINPVDLRLLNMNNHNNHHHPHHHHNGSTLPPNNSQQKLVSADFLAKSTNRRNRIAAGRGGSDGEFFPTSDSDQSLPRRNDNKVTTGQWITVAVLCYVNLINYMDRFTIAGILDQIQCSLNISNSEAGLLQTAFVVSYMVFAPIFGYLGDRYSRRYIMAAGVFLWSLTTFLGSFMEEYGTFITFRALVGIGEASYSTIAPTIISDLFVDGLRSKMLAFFYFAIPVGSGMGYIIGSETAALGGSWHWGLRVTPVMGAIAVLLILFVMIDPPRGESEGSHLEVTSYKEDLSYLVKNRSFMLSTLGFTCVAFVTGALAWWGPTFITLGLQSHSESVVDMKQVSLIFGVITMLSGLIGVPTGAALSTVLKRRNPRADPLICAFGLLASTPLMFLAAIMAGYNEISCYVLIFFASLFLNLNWSIVADMLLYVVIPTRRSTAEAFQILLSHTLGDAGSPYLIGQISELLKHTLSVGYSAVEEVKSANATLLNNETIVVSKGCGTDDHSDNPLLDFKSLQYSLFITSFVEVLGGLFFLMTAWYIISDKTKADKAISGNELMGEGSHPEIHEADEISSSSSSTPSI